MHSFYSSGCIFNLLYSFIHTSILHALTTFSSPTHRVVVPSGQVHFETRSNTGPKFSSLYCPVSSDLLLLNDIPCINTRQHFHKKSYEFTNCWKNRELCLKRTTSFRAIRLIRLCWTCEWECLNSKLMCVEESFFEYMSILNICIGKLFIVVWKIYRKMHMPLFHSMDCSKL